MEVGEADVHLKDLFSPEYCGWVGVDSPEEALINCKKELIEQGYDWPSSTLLESDAEEERAKLMRRTKAIQNGNVKFHERMAVGGSNRRQNHLTKCGCSVPIVFTPDIVAHNWYGQNMRSAAFEAQSVENALPTADHVVDTLKRLRQRLGLTPASTSASASGASTGAIASSSASNVSAPASASGSEAVAIEVSEVPNVSADDDGDSWTARDLVISKALEATDAIIGDDARESCRILRRDITTYEEAAVQFDDVNPVRSHCSSRQSWSGRFPVKPRRCFSALSWLHVSSPSWLTSKRAVGSNMNRSTLTRSANSA